MNEDAIRSLAAFVRQRFDRSFVDQFDTERDPRLAEITNRVISSIRRDLDDPHPIDVYDAAWHAAKERDPDVFADEDDGTEFVADPAWVAAEKAAFSAAVAYGYPELVTDDERDLLVEEWERIVGTSTAAGLS